MSLTGYNNYKEALESLKAEIRQIVAAGEEYLPPERELAIKLGASRVTLRKALGIAESEGLLISLGRKRKVSNAFANSSQCGRIAFMSAGLNGVFTMPAMERIWNTLHVMLLKNKADVHLLLTDPNDDGTAICQELEMADVILYAGGGERGRDQCIRKELESLRPRKKILSLLDADRDLIPDFVVLDNYRVGQMAAEALIEAGCRKPFAIWGVCNNSDFAHRAQGFADKLAEHQRGGIQSVFWVSHEDGAISGNCRAHMEWAFSHGFDGVFLMSDEYIGEIVGFLYARNLVPDKIKIVTMDGTREAFRHTPPVSCFTHSSKALANAVLEQLGKIANGTYRPVQQLIEPGFHDNGSLRAL